ncbi:putative lipoprotein [Myxococcus stipitatus DSM 14675]|uniref:Putative lipoprotein n=1 Tax=Myxococcus stipitatus (strain DSM 14675 / JCM 12634 / Mx s8) TaxID=1278073 RepID=L7UAA9_MYXSD|nr:right-handed parallel beta-helix repeat-containing protein [Myxococcus stipitatus]AGC44973.1 putative lipoprotein [Myxococcus stipitatus DSM 14675]
MKTLALSDVVSRFALVVPLLGLCACGGEPASTTLADEELGTPTLHLEAASAPSEDTGSRGTLISGTLSGTLTLTGSPYLISGDANGVVTVPKGHVLKVMPGVILDFRGRPDVTEADVDPHSPSSVMNHQRGRVEMRVYGGIQVRGTASQPVIFTSTNPYGWWGMNFFGAGSVGDGHPYFESMVFEKVRKNDYNGPRGSTRGALWAYYLGPVTILNSVFRNNVASAKCGALDLMFTVGSRVENSTFEYNGTLDIDRFAQAGSYAMTGGGAMCVTHGRNSVVRNNVFRGNGLEAFSGFTWNRLARRPLLDWPNVQGTYDLGGGGALHYFQPDNDLIENNRFVGNFVTQGPAAAIYVEHIGTRGVLLRGNRFENNQSASGGVVVCNRGSGGVNLVLAADNLFSGNKVNGGMAPPVSGDCSVAAQ